MKKYLLVGAAALMASLSLASMSQAADLKIKVNPSAPIVDDSITVSWTVVKPLKAGWHYDVSLVGKSGYACNGFVTNGEQAQPRQGQAHVDVLLAL